MAGAAVGLAKEMAPERHRRETIMVFCIIATALA
jgi:hypothetical protein